MASHWTVLRTAGLLLLSNCFMTAAWYGHLRFKHAPLLIAILLSWCLALPEYALQVPANRLGYGKLNVYQLKIMQECITLVVFMVFAQLFLGEAPQMKYLISFAFVLGAVGVAFS
ncbi:MAG: DMT family protein [Bdellovibrionota bacterium]